jgi:hypothetical protein
VDSNLVALVLGELAFVAFVSWLLVPFFREKARLRAELLRGVVDRFTSAPELAAFLETEAGRRFEAALAGRPFVPLARLLNGVGLGIVLVVLAVGLAAAGQMNGDPDLRVAAVVVLSLGAGFLVAAYVSHRLCRALRLLP